MSLFDPVAYREMEKKAYSGAAESYEKYGSAIFEGLASPLLEKAALVAGETVLDVACGPGIPSLEAATAVGPGGSVTGLDLAPGMVELARSKARARGLTNVSFREGDAESLPFADGSFDVVLCNMGLIHVPDRAAALGEMRRVLKRDGRVALSVWSTPERSVNLGIIAKAIAEHWPRAIVPGAPTWFDLGPDGALEKALEGAGFREIRTGRIGFPLEMEDSESYWEACLGISGRLRMVLREIPREAAERIESSAREAADRFRKGDSLVIPGEEVVGWARA